MARMTKTTVKPAVTKKKADPGLTAAEQARLKKEWELKNKKKLPSGANLGVSSVENFRRGSGSYSITSTHSNTTMPKPEPIGTLATKKLTSGIKTPEITRVETKKKVEEKEEFKPQPKAKKLTRGGGLTGNVGTTVKNIVGKQQFKKEQKQKAAYKRATSASGTGSMAGMSKGSKEANLKQNLKDLKSVKRDVKKSTGVSLRPDIKDTRKAIRYVRRKG